MNDQPLSDQLMLAARAFFPETAAIVPVPVHPNIARVETDAGEWRVRRWPGNVAVERIRFVHELLDTAEKAELSITPRLYRSAEEALVRIEGFAYDATSWIPGRPAVRYPPTIGPDGSALHVPAPLARATLDDLTTRVAELHVALQPIARHSHAPVVTLNGIEQAVQASWQSSRDRLRPIAMRTPPVQRWLRTAERALPAAEQTLSGASSAVLERQVVGHFGLWPAHVILHRPGGEERVAGLIDFARAAVGPPVLDLAHLATRFGTWSAETLEQVTGAYSAVTDLPPEDRRLVPAVAVLDLAAEVGRLLSATYVTNDADSPPAPSALRAGVETLLTTFEAATAAMLRLEGPDRPARRQWVPGRRKPRGVRPGRRDRPRPNR